MNVQILTELDQVLQHRKAWDDLWQRTLPRPPISRAATTEHWFRSLVPASEFRAVVVETHGVWSAVLPFLLRRRGPVRIARLPQHVVGIAPQMLFDAQVDSDQVARGLLEGLRESGADLAWFDDMPEQGMGWESLRIAGEQFGRSFTEPRRPFGRIAFSGDWQDYHQSLSHNLRRNLSKAENRLAKLGQVDDLDLVSFGPDEWLEPLEKFLRIEDQNWKGEAGSSILRTPGMADYFRGQAKLLAESGELEMLFLTCDQKPIAADFGYRIGDTFYSHKIGYDQAFASYSPGQLLLARQIRRYCAQGDCQRIETLGPVTPTLQRWVNASDPRVRWSQALRRPLGGAAVRVIEAAIGGYRAWKGRGAPVETAGNLATASESATSNP